MRRRLTRPRTRVLDDDMLRLIFTCCHPSFAAEVQVALTLRTVCGLSTAQVARAFLAAKTRWRSVWCAPSRRSGSPAFPTKCPTRRAGAAAARRAGGDLSRLHRRLRRNVGRRSDAAGSGARSDPAGAAARCADAGRGEIKGLLALMLLHDARRAGRATAGGDIVLLEEQDRSLWDQAQIAEGLRLVEDALRMPGRPQSYAVQAAIAALHARAPNYEDTDWPQIAGLYEVLLRISPSPVIELNHAAAVSMVDGPARALDLIDALDARGGSTATNCCRRSAPTCCAGSAGAMPRARPIGRRHAATQLEPLRRLYARRIAELEGSEAVSTSPRLSRPSTTFVPIKVRRGCPGQRA